MVYKLLTLIVKSFSQNIGTFGVLNVGRFYHRLRKVFGSR
jgi:hypothetical protein